ncbi:CoA-binding protein [Mycobacterium crocinum]|uniref:CoA-binding protein n=1 Tax=Mycolicibacterium crocinum TaxID=388459 RepID=A0ABY3TMH6_9MYCO|nr:CoA-binding protein [Mycolicibacterium crocinum]APE17259.1 CoA-binding protein [Mycobacterium sp. WY10]MCV7216538.1 CoA-binding protein [Mycolicibacterium crocinum]ULN41907.1 CoA-binding protein [Mycolicibacterium crocinum]
MAAPNSAELQEILRDTRTVAVVGASNNPARPSYGVYQYLARFSHYELYPVNPTISDIDGTPVYPSLADLPVVPDMVDVFRRYDDLPAVLADTLALNPHPKYLWLQQGLWHDEVGEQAEAAGLRVVMDRCLKVDYAQLIGR